MAGSKSLTLNISLDGGAHFCDKIQNIHVKKTNIVINSHK